MFDLGNEKHDLNFSEQRNNDQRRDVQQKEEVDLLFDENLAKLRITPFDSQKKFRRPRKSD